MTSIVKDNEASELDAALTQAMRGLAKSVVVISTVNGLGERRAMVATAVTSVSMEPPSMLICVNRDASSYPAFLEGENFCINLLHAGQESLARFCTRTSNGESRFQMGDWTSDASGTPYLADAQASIICRQDQRFSYGTHDIFVGEVVSVYNVGAVDPLVYLNGDYRTIETPNLAKHQN